MEKRASDIKVGDTILVQGKPEVVEQTAVSEASAKITMLFEGGRYVAYYPGRRIEVVAEAAQAQKEGAR